ncbi:hypothetical protein RYX36_010877, partial [Vicia faba]
MKNRSQANHIISPISDLLNASPTLFSGNDSNTVQLSRSSSFSGRKLVGGQGFGIPHRKLGESNYQSDPKFSFKILVSDRS